MQWLRIKIDVPVEYADFAGDVLWQMGSRGVEYIDPCDLFWTRRPGQGDEVQIDESLPSSRSSRISVVGYLSLDRQVSDIARDAKKALDEGGVSGSSISLEPFDDAEWQDEWRRSFRPLRLSERVAVIPEWEQATVQPGEVAVRLDPGMAFGTGSHPTTVMCARMLEHCVRSGDRVLDLGTGSGILAILSALLGASAVTAVDVDDVAVEKARHNVELNEVGDVVRVLRGDLVAGIESTYDVVVANIIASVITRLMPDVKRVLAPAGKLIVSGIIEDRKDECLDAALTAGLEIVEVHKDGEWVGALLKQ